MTDLRLVMNQVADTKFLLQQDNLRAYSAFAECPKCGRRGYTRAELQCSVGSVLSCFCFGQCWMLWQIYKKKDLNCYDSVHTCPQCNAVLADYKSCVFP